MTVEGADRSASKINETLVRAVFAVLLGGVFWLALIPNPPKIIPAMNDKAEHASAFLVLSLLGLLGWPRAPISIVLFLSVIGGGIELLQGTHFVNRDMSVFDWVADLFGVAVGTVAGCAIIRPRSQ